MIMRILVKSVYILMPVVIVLAFLWAPPAEGLGETARIIFFHVPLAWGSFLAFVIAGIFSIIYLIDKENKFPGLDEKAYNSAVIGFVFTILAIILGSVWAKLTWGSFWNWDPRQTSIVIVLLIYIAYFSLQAALAGNENRGKIGSSYLIVAMVMLPFFIFVVPRIYLSLHPNTIINVKRKIFMEQKMFITLLISISTFTVLYFYILQIMNRITVIKNRIEDATHAEE